MCQLNLIQTPFQSAFPEEISHMTFDLTDSAHNLTHTHLNLSGNHR